MTRLKNAGVSIYEMVLGMFLVFALLLGVLLLLTWERGEGDGAYGVNPYRAHYAAYMRDRLEAWRVAILNYIDMTGTLPGDAPGGTNSTGNAIGNSNNRVERENGENVKFFQDLMAMGLSPSPQIRVRGKIMDFYWVDLTRNGTTAKPGNFMKLPNINADEALALDHATDDGSRNSGNVVYFPNPDGTVDLFVRFEPF